MSWLTRTDEERLERWNAMLDRAKDKPDESRRIIGNVLLVTLGIGLVLGLAAGLMLGAAVL